MACFVPFNNKNLDISLFAFRPTVVYVDELVDALKQFSLCTKTLGCVQSAIFKSIHGSLIIWYGAWMKSDNKDLLNATLLSMLRNISSMGILVEQGFFSAYVGESKDGYPSAKFSTGDTISMKSVNLKKDDTNDLSYACLAIFKSRFSKIEGVISGVCFKCHSQTRTVNLMVWKSLQSCYSFIFESDYRKTIMPYLDNLSPQVKYDIFKVVYVSGDHAPNFGLNFSHQMLKNGKESTEGIAG